MPTPLERVVVIGTSCAGKSTFAADLARVLGHSSFDLDHLFWGPDWTTKPIEEFRNLTAQAASAERWVASGNYSDVRDLLWSRATAVVWLNYGLPTVLWRAIRRTIRRNVTREELWHGNRESLKRSFFSRESILVWVASTFHKRQRRFRELRASGAFPHVAWVEFRRPVEAKYYLHALENAC